MAFQRSWQMRTLFLEAGSVSLFYQSPCKSRKNQNLIFIATSPFLVLFTLQFRFIFNQIRQSETVSRHFCIHIDEVLKAWCIFFKRHFPQGNFPQQWGFFFTVSTFRIGRSVNKPKFFMYEETGNFYLVFSSQMFPVFGKVCTTNFGCQS